MFLPGSSVRWILLALGFCIPWMSAAQADVDDTARDQRELDVYFDSLYQGAVAELNTAYAALPAARKGRLARSTIKLDLLSGADELCLNKGRFKVAASKPKDATGFATIVLCEPDLAHLADAIIVWNLAFASQAEKVMTLKLKPKQSLPADIDAAIKLQTRRGVEYLIAANAVKKQVLSEGRIPRSSCFGWQVFDRVESTSGPVQCARRDFDARADQAAAANALRSLVKAMVVMARLADPSRVVETPELLPGADVVGAMHRIRSEIFSRAIRYAVAHELGHLTSDNPQARTKEAEQDADRMAIPSLGESASEASLLVSMTVALEVIWQMAGDPRHLGRTDSLHDLVFCGDTSHWTSGPLNPEFAAKVTLLLTSSSCRR